MIGFNIEPHPRGILAPMNARPQTFGERMRHARTSANLSQAQLAAGICTIANTSTSKALISQWEADKVRHPHSAAVLAVCAITGFSQHWLLNGRGPERAKLPALHVTRGSETRSLLRRAILAAQTAHTSPQAIADAAVTCYETLMDEPHASDVALEHVARRVKRAKR